MALPAAILISMAIGALVAFLLLPEFWRNRTGVLFGVCLGAGLGAGISSTLYFLIWLWLGPSTRTFVAVELVILGWLAAGCWMGRGARALKAAPSARTMHWLLLTGFVAALAIAVAFFVDAFRSNPYGEWDAWTLWNLRAEFLAQNDASWRNAFSGLLSRTHPDYPLLLSGFIASCWSLMGSIGAPSAPIAVSALFTFATTGLLVAALAILRSWNAGLLAGLILIASPGFLLAGETQFADVPLSFYYLAFLALTLLAAQMNHGAAQALVLAGLAAGFAAWTKNEGLLFLAVSSIGICISAKRKALWGLAAGAAGPLLIALYFKFALAPGGQGLFATTGKLFQISRYAQVAKGFWNEALGFGLGTIHPIIPLAIVVASLGISARRARAVMVPFAILLAMLAGYFLTFVITPFDLTWQLSTSLGRLYVQLWPSFLLVTFAAIRTPEETATPVAPVEKAPATKGRKSKKADSTGVQPV